MDVRTRLALVLATAAACTPKVKIATDTPGMDDVLTKGVGKLGLKAEIVAERGPGVFFVEFRAPEGRVCGRALDRIVDPESFREVLTEGAVECQPIAWACDGPDYTDEWRSTVVAHEVGHLMGLNHKGGTLMAPAPKTDAVLDKSQRWIVRGVAQGFALACVDAAPNETEAP